ncbi:hypothetical protein MtrunA17_Chr2g0331171 [Medicago truncatula]|uniref:Uncharacterized protein n=1 Tax=Medicago truncatula TaxID=3880 RepID=A0A396JDM5_MEDTR|nr:hypothetical protein MtrunA17_Chr2g0331171 [Medicago truncatula]
MRSETMGNPSIHVFTSSIDKASTFLVEAFLGARFFPAAATAVAAWGSDAEITVRVTVNLRKLRFWGLNL